MKLTPSPRAKVQPLPQLILAGRILQVSAVDLERVIMLELEENPALELIEEVAVPWEGRMATAPSEEETIDPLELSAAEVSLEEYLLQQMMPHLQPQQMPIAQFLVESLDSHGLLTTPLEAIAEMASVSEKEVAAVLSILQEQEPRGIGARSVQECLLLQLRQLQEEGEDYGPSQKLARTLIAEHWEELGKAGLPRLARAVGAKLEVQGALDFIRHNLNPFPAHAYSEGGEVNFVRPDVILRHSPGEKEMSIEFPEQGRYRLRVDPLYQELASASGASPEVSQEERERLRAFTERARLFISSLEQRWQTLRRILQELLEVQHDFFLNGPRHLQPLTRAQLADALGVHESTVSRAVADKFLQLPNGQVLPLADLFDGSLAIKDRIQGIIAQETKPLSDAQIAGRLRQEGIRVARRTVAKYREALGILPANLRHPRSRKSEQ